MKKLTENKIMNDTALIFEKIGNFLSTAVVALFELLDNSVGADATMVTVTLTEKEDCVELEIEDNGTGIENMGDAWAMARVSKAKGFIHRAGMGLKVGVSKLARLASIFKCATRVSEKKEIVVFEGPYDDKKDFEITDKWPGKMKSSHGTYLKITMERSVFNTFAFRNNTKSFDVVADCMFEHIGFRYARIIKKKICAFKMIAFDINGTEICNKLVNPMIPKSKILKNDKGQEARLDKYPVIPGLEINAVWKEIMAMPKRVGHKFDNRYSRFYYQANQNSQGAYFYLQDICIVGPLFSEVWGKANHDSYNYLVVDVDLMPETKKDLPASTTHKGAIDEADSRWDKLFYVLRNAHLVKARVPEKELKKQALNVWLYKVLQSEPDISFVTKGDEISLGDVISTKEKEHPSFYCTFKHRNPMVVVTCNSGAGYQSIWDAVLCAVKSLIV